MEHVFISVWIATEQGNARSEVHTNREEFVEWLQETPPNQWPDSVIGLIREGIGGGAGVATAHTPLSILIDVVEQ